MDDIYLLSYDAPLCDLHFLLVSVSQCTSIPCQYMYSCEWSKRHDSNILGGSVGYCVDVVNLQLKACTPQYFSCRVSCMSLKSPALILGFCAVMVLCVLCVLCVVGLFSAIGGPRWRYITVMVMGGIRISVVYLCPWWEQCAFSFTSADGTVPKHCFRNRIYVHTNKTFLAHLLRSWHVDVLYIVHIPT